MAIATQFAFEAGPIIEWANSIKNAGIDIPIHIGIAGPAKLQTLIKFAIACGVGPSTAAWLWSLQGSRVPWQAASMRATVDCPSDRCARRMDKSTCCRRAPHSNLLKPAAGRCFHVRWSHQNRSDVETPLLLAAIALRAPRPAHKATTALLPAQCCQWSTTTSRCTGALRTVRSVAEINR